MLNVDGNCKYVHPTKTASKGLFESRLLAHRLISLFDLLHLNGVLLLRHLNRFRMASIKTRVSP